MKTWIITRWDAMQSSFCVVPVLMAVAAITMGFVMPEIDKAIDHEMPSLLQSTGPSARAMVSTIAGAMITVVGVVFSITIVTLSLTSSQFGSRLLRSYMSDIVTQVTLGTFVATSMYCLIVLRTINQRTLDNGDETWFVPHLSAGLAELLALVSLLVLIYFIHHVSQSVQAWNVVENVAIDLDEALERLFPERLGRPAPSPAIDEAILERFASGENVAGVSIDREGYLEGIDDGSLLAAAVDNDLVIRLDVQPGNFIDRSQTILRALPADRVDDEVRNALRTAFVVGHRRTPRQDLECPIHELVEVAIRALSPGINDPYTAVACVDRLGAALTRLAGREMPERFRLDKQGDLRVICKETTFVSALNTAFDQIRQYGRTSVAVSIRQLQALQRIAPHVQRPGDRAAVVRQAEMIRRASEAALPEENDRQDVARHFGRVTEELRELET